MSVLRKICPSWVLATSFNRRVTLTFLHIQPRKFSKLQPKAWSTITSGSSSMVARGSKSRGMVLDKDEDLRNPRVLEEFIIRTRLHMQEHVQELRHPPRPHMHALNNSIPGLHEKWERVLGEVHGLTRECCEPESEKWKLATERIFNKHIEMRDGSSWSPSTEENASNNKAGMAWEFISALLPRLKDDDEAKGRFQQFLDR